MATATATATRSSTRSPTSSTRPLLRCTWLLHGLVDRRRSRSVLPRVGVGGVTSTARSAVRASGEGRASVRAWTHTWERGAASTADLSSPVSPSWGGRGWARVGGGGHIDRALCRARERGGKSERASLDVPGRGERRQRWTCPDVNGGEGVRGEGAVVQSWYCREEGGGERARGGGGGVSGGDAPWYGERERERGGARAGRGRREACLAGGRGAVLVSSAAGAAEVTIPPSCRRA
jgi:hypothetical protein